VADRQYRLDLAERWATVHRALLRVKKAALATLTRNSGYALIRNRIHLNQLDIGGMASDHERELQLAGSGDLEWEKKAGARRDSRRAAEACAAGTRR
jgi:hypothetical protein